MSILKKFLTTAALATALMAQTAAAENVKIAIVVKALGIGGHEAHAFGGEVHGHAHGALCAVGAQAQAFDIQAAHALLVVDQGGAGALAQRRCAAGHGRRKALVEVADDALATEAGGVDDVGGGHARCFDDLGGDGGQVFVRHGELQEVDLMNSAGGRAFGSPRSDRHGRSVSKSARGDTSI